MRYALIQNGIVVNVIEWDGISQFNPDGILVQSDTANIGDLYNPDDGTFTTPPIYYNRGDPILWTPEVDLGEKLITNWNADDLPDGPVATWTDNMGGILATQTDVTKQPSKDSSLGGLVIQQGSNQFLTFPTISRPTRRNRTLIIVGKFFISAAPNSSGIIFAVNGTSGSVDNRAPGCGYNRAAINTLYVQWATASSLSMPVIDESKWLVIVDRRMNGVHKLSGNGAAELNDGTNVLIPRNVTNQLGIIGDVRASSIGMIISRIMLIEEITDDELASIQGWALWDKGEQSSLPSGHPYAILQPLTKPYVNSIPMVTQAEWDTLRGYWTSPVSTHLEHNYGQPISPYFTRLPLKLDQEFTDPSSIFDEAAAPSGSSFHACTYDSANGAATQRSRNQTPVTYTFSGTEAAIIMQQTDKWYSGGFCSLNIDGQGNYWDPSDGPLYVEWTCRVSPGKGSWPGLWLKNRNEFFNPRGSRVEIDVGEFYGGDPMANHESLHMWPPDMPWPGRITTHQYTSNYTGMKSGGPWPLAPISLTDNNYHKIAVSIDKAWLVYYVDDYETCRIPSMRVFFQQLYILVDLALNPAELTIAVSPIAMGMKSIKVRQGTYNASATADTTTVKADNTLILGDAA